MKRVYAAANLQDAHILLGLLAQAGIGARILNAAANGGLGEIPFTQTYPEVWVSEERDLPRARELVDAFERPATAGAAQVCPRCAEQSPGHFAQCWSCGASLED